MYYFPEYMKMRFDRILESPLTVIEAGSGCGKSTAMNGYFLKQPASEYIKLYYTCLGENPENTWERISDIISEIDNEVGQYLKSLILPTKANMGNIASQLRYLSCDKPTILCIDNYQLFDIADKDMLIEALSVHNCDNLHLVIMTQSYGQDKNRFFMKFPLYFIPAQAFYFSKTDIDNYFKQEKVNLGKEDLDAVWDMTEGYATAIQLQLESWKYYGHFEDASRISTLMEKVLWRHLRPEEQECLLSLCVVESFSLKQGVIMTENIMAEEQFGNFVEQMDFVRYDAGNQCYIFHHLLLILVREKFKNHSKEYQKNAWEKAAIAYENSGDHLSTARFFGKCQDYNSLVKLDYDKDDRVDLVRMENGNIISQLIHPSQRHLLYENPELTLSLTLELFVQGKMIFFAQYMEVVNDIFEQLDWYDEERASNLKGEYDLMRSFMVFNDVQQMCAYHRSAWKHMKRATHLYSLNTAWTFGIPSVVCMFWRESGKLNQVLQEVKDGMPLYYKLAEGNGMGAHQAMEGEIALLRGDTKTAKKSYRSALYDAEKMFQDSICYCAYLGMARVAIFTGNVASYTHMQENIDDRPYIGQEKSCILTTDICKGYLAILLDQFKDISEWLCSEEEIHNKGLMLTKPFMHVIYGRIQLERMKKHEISYEKFEEEMYQWIEECRQLHMLLPEVYYWIYLAAGSDAVGHYSEATERMQAVLQLCIEDSILLPFAENYGIISRLLQSTYLRGNLLEMREKINVLGEQFLKGKRAILSAINVTEKVLTMREKEIAVLLKQRHSVKEIAEKLCISPSTVSNTMQSIYSKLGIHSKRELYCRDDI